MLIVHGCQNREFDELRRDTLPYPNIKLLQVSNGQMIFLLHHVFLLGKVRNVWYTSQVSVITVTYPASSFLSHSTVTPLSTSTFTTITIIASPTPLPITCSTGDIRIISGNIVQWCVDTVWKPICFDDKWDYREAIVSCKEVGLESAGKFIYLT